MSDFSRARSQVAGVARRLDALLDESVAPLDALDILVAQQHLPARIDSTADQPLASAVRTALAHAGFPQRSVELIGNFLRDCEVRGHGQRAVRLLGRVDEARRRSLRERAAYGVIAIEFLLLVLVVAIQSIFVLPQFEAIFEASAMPLPALTRFLLAAQPLISFIALVALITLIGLVFPILLRPIRRPLDRLLLAVGATGEVLRKRNSDLLCGWLGLAASTPASQRTAIEAAQVWHADELLARVCAIVLSGAGQGENLSLRIDQSHGFDRDFQSTMKIAGDKERSSAMRARWRNVESLPEHPPGKAPVVVHVILGVLIALAVIAMYQPIFKLGATL